jgi:hypothetical protein
LSEVLRACLDECGDDSVELELQLRTRERVEVEALIGRLRAAIAENRHVLKETP